MNEHVLQTIELVREQVNALERQLAEKKRMVNDLCRLAGRDALYANSEPAVNGTVIRPDEFYGRPIADVIRFVLEKRKLAGLGAATVPEIYQDIIKGGYHFQAKSEENAKRGIYICLAKNPTVFHKLPNGRYGLLSWYPAAKPQVDNEDTETTEEK